MSNFNKTINPLTFTSSSVLAFIGGYFFITGEKSIAHVLLIAAIILYALSLFFSACKKTIRFNKVIKVKTFISSFISFCISGYFFITNKYQLAILFFIAAIAKYAISLFFRNRDKIKEVKNNENDQVERYYDTKEKESHGQEKKHP